MKLCISGHSDDVVCYTLGDRSDELSPPSSGPFMGTLLIHSPRGRCLVHVIYDGCWSFTVAKVDEDDGDLFKQERAWEGYSELLTLTVPKRTKIGWR